MEILGYSDPLSVRPGQAIDFMVSCEAESYRADIVRLIHGDENPLGPGFVEEEVGSDADGVYAGTVQPIAIGSAIEVPDDPALRPARICVVAHVLATTPVGRRQGIVTKTSPDGDIGYGLFLDEGGHAEFVVGTAAGSIRARTTAPLTSHRWYSLAGSYDPSDGRVSVVKVAREFGGIEAGTVDAVHETHSPSDVVHSNGPLLMAAAWNGKGDGSRSLGSHFNGKISAPAVFDSALTSSELEAVFGDRSAGTPVAQWDLALKQSSSQVADMSSNGLHGRALNMPTRAVTGHTWNGASTHFGSAPDDYDAIHFHDDDLEDAGWDPGVRWNVPDTLPSGIYALRLRAEADGDSGGIDHVPFFVLPPIGGTESIAFLAPTNCYFAYANERLEDNLGLDAHPDYVDPEGGYDYIIEHRLRSLYDHHGDGSGVCYSSRLRPNLTMRPRHRMRMNNIPRLLASDLHTVEWLEHEGFGHDVLTDEALHHEGIDLLSPYRVVITGSHPEYWSGEMLDAMEAYLAGGGRCMYLGGNGFYWVTAFDPERPHVMEVRRLPGSTRAWEAWPGEYHLSSTGEYGGLWRHRGRAPQQLLGVGFSAQGFDHSAPYTVNPDLADEMAFVFDGVDLADGVIADQPSLVLGYGAAGFELDRIDHVLGTPVGTELLASTLPGAFSDSYQAVVEETMMSDSRQGGPVNENVKADIVMVPHPNGGAVFSVSSIAWSGGLSVEGYESDVSKITRNVLNAFLTEPTIG